MSNIEIRHGDLLEAQVEVLVNTVNCVGVMGKGIALQFEKTFPDNARAYKAVCKARQLRPGGIFVFEMPLQLERQQPHYIFNFATKDHWRDKSRIEWIEAGLQQLITEVESRKVKSIAIPPLGCGNGGLSWEQVRPLIINALANMPDVHVLLFPPEGAPEATQIAAAPVAPKMTLDAALFIKLLAQYSVIDLEFSRLEIQKLVYFLKEAGQPLKRLKFEKMQYGPAARELDPMLNRWEKHWILGFGDGTGGRREPIFLKPSTIEQATAYIQANPSPESEARVEQVIRLIEGMDTALGLELLASVHWVARHDSKAGSDLNEIVTQVHDWNEHKKNTFPRGQIELAWNRLKERGWLNELRPEWMTPFQCDDVAGVVNFVNSNPDLEAVLTEAVKQLRSLFPKDSFWLDLLKNPEDQRSELLLLVQSELSPRQRMAQLEEFDRRWWGDKAARWQGMFSISLA